MSDYMREILFRGKRLDNGEWVKGFVVRRPSAIYIGDCSPWWISVPPTDPDDNGGMYNIDPSTVGQYTGLKDKNGKKVFEGDILWLEDTRANYGWYGRVEFGNPNGKYNWGFQLVHLEEVQLVYLERPLPKVDILLWFDMEECGVFAEIVGTIHDHPELLEGGG